MSLQYSLTMTLGEEFATDNCQAQPSGGGAVAMNPTPDGQIYSSCLNVNVATDNPWGYTLTMRSETANLVSGSNSILAHSGTIAAPTVLSNDRWGFCIPNIYMQRAGAGVFGNGGSCGAANNIGSDTAYSYAGLPTINTIIKRVNNTPSTAAEANTPIRFGVRPTAATPVGTYVATVTITASLNAMPLPTAQNGDIMQEIGRTLSCPTTRTWMIDARDNRTYWVREIPDTRADVGDLCWMETNLAYAGGGTNTYGDVRAITNSESASSTDAFFMIPPGANPTSNPTSPSLSTTGGGQLGYLYNWCAAMGNQQGTAACTNAAAPLPDANISICPGGWRLPIGGPGGEWTLLNNAINSGSTSSTSGLLTNSLFMYSGVWDDYFQYQGEGGDYWSGTLADATSAWYIWLYSHTWGVNPSATADTSIGLAVRCVADD
ncbi:hypothetical protein FWH13_02180 [Candidatus Saccharibacteria bacterium]|nr:hypothetical protein [Candidatus Saccharibacteria bacterium]